MTLEAVYEGGTLRLMQPIDLPEGTRVEITLVKSKLNSQQKTPADILTAIASLPLEGDRDEFSGRDHDKILYPGRQKYLDPGFPRRTGVSPVPDI